MKRILKAICLVLYSAMCLCISACGFSEKDATYVEDGFTNEMLASDAELIKDYDGLKDYISNTDMSEEMQGKLAAYDNEYFDENMLVVICHWEDKGASFIEVDDVNYEGNWAHVELDRKSSDVAARDMKSWGIIVEIKRDDNLTSASYSID